MNDLRITDPMEAAPSRIPLLDRLGRALVNDPRDLPFFALSVEIACVLLPFAALLFVPGVLAGWWGWLFAVAYYAVWGLGYLDRYILMLHNTSHRRFIKSQYGWMNHIIPRVFGPFFGETPDTYFTHHVGMHHVENNLEDDLSSTMQYDRDSFAGFLHYYARFIVLGIIEVTGYFYKRKQTKLFRRTLLGELAAYAIYAALAYLNWRATLVVFVVPLFFTRWMMLAGNWGQHAFIDASDPGNSYRNSITCINTRYNRRAFNDGYHIGHHVKATRHWTEMPGDFLASREEYVRQGSIVFEGVDFFMVWLYLMTGRWQTLARHYVALDGKPRSEEEIIALLKLRTRRCVRDAATLATAA